jgi:hypothetical protein
MLPGLIAHVLYIKSHHHLHLQNLVHMSKNELYVAMQKIHGGFTFIDKYQGYFSPIYVI